MKTILEQDLIQDEIYDDGNGVLLKFIEFEENEGERSMTLFELVDKTSTRYSPRKLDGLIDFTYRPNEKWFQPSED